MILKDTYYEFRLGFEISSVSFRISFGWIGFTILWSRVKSEIDLLPIDHAKEPFHVPGCVFPCPGCTADLPRSYTNAPTASEDK